MADGPRAIRLRRDGPDERDTEKKSGEADSGGQKSHGQCWAEWLGSAAKPGSPMESADEEEARAESAQA